MRTILYIFPITFSLICVLTFSINTQLKGQNTCATATPFALGNTTHCFSPSGQSFVADMTTAGGTGVEAYSCDNADVAFWYSFTAPASGEINVFMYEDFAATALPDFIMYSGACGALTQEECVQGFNLEHGQLFTGLIGGNTYYIQLANYTVDDPTLGVITMCIQESPCNDPSAPADDCGDATLIDFAQAYVGTTLCGYNQDILPFVLDGCNFAITNNSWFTFEATATTVEIEYVVSNCDSGSGIQLAVLEGTCVDNTTMTTVSGTCAAISNPLTPGSATLSFSGLTIGNDYFLMVDGFADDRCFYSFEPISGIGCTGAIEFLKE